MASRFKSPAWNYFDRRGDVLTCRVCNGELKFAKNTSSMLNHLRLKHPLEFKEMKTSSGQGTTPSISKSELSAYVQPNLVEALDRTEENTPDASKEIRLPKIGARMKSPVWNYMEKKGDVVLCLLCNAEMKNHGNTTNFYNHLLYRHNLDFGEMKTASEQKTTSSKNELELSSAFQPNLGDTLDGSKESTHDPTEESMRDSSMESQFRRTTVRKSAAWNYMERHGNILICNICKTALTYSKNTTNMWNHLKLKHPVEYGEISAATTSDKRTKPAAAIPPSVVKTLEKHEKYKPGSTRKELLDLDLLLLMVQDLQPFSIIEDKGFRRLLSDMDNRYQLPSQHEITHNLLPKLFEETKPKIYQEICDASAISLTTDLWKSQNKQLFMSITANFISQEWEFKSYVLETAILGISYTTQSIVEELTRIIDEWKIQHKVVAVVADNALNISSAVNHLGLTHIPCFATTINHVVNGTINAIKSVEEVKEKVKSIVSYIHSSMQCTEKLEELQLQNGKAQRQLVQETDMKWNSAFQMLQRYQEDCRLITNVLHFAEKHDLCLSDEENIHVKMVVKALGPFDVVVQELCGENFTTLSKVLPLVYSLQDYYLSLQTEECNPLISELLNQLERHFPCLEEKYEFAVSTFLDPRFKKFAFRSQEIMQGLETQLIRQMQVPELKGYSPWKPQSSESEASESQELCEFWATFDKKIDSHLRATPEPAIRLDLELRQFNEELPIRRNADLLVWWKENAPMLPQLHNCARRYLSIPASSIPSVRLFSTSGETASHRRSCLEPESINQVLFLNKNINM